MYVYLSQDQHNKEYLNQRFYLTQGLTIHNGKKHFNRLVRTIQSQCFLWKAEKRGRNNLSKEKTKLGR